VAQAGEMAIGGAGSGLRPAPQEMAKRALRMLERLAAGATLPEVAAGEGLSPRRARELVAEVVAQRGFDP
jgi:DNA-binding CsgD family transcriptional regulator